MSDEQQRGYLADKEKAESLLRLLFVIVKKVRGQPELVTLALLLIDGILEDSRSKV